MRLFQLEYIKDNMRAKGWLITKETNKPDICDLLLFPRNTSNKKICDHLEMVYPITDGWYNEKRVIYLYYWDKVRIFKSISNLRKFLNINILTSRYYELLDKVFILKGNLVYFSFNKQDRDFSDLLPIMSSKFLLLVKLFNENHRFRIGVSIREIYQRFNLPQPKKYRLRFLCRAFDSPYYPTSGGIFREKSSIGAISDRGDIMSFETIGEASDYFETNHMNIILSMERDVKFPFNQTLWLFTRLWLLFSLYLTKK